VYPLDFMDVDLFLSIGAELSYKLLAGCIGSKKMVPDIYNLY
jgi:hypothetical protein